MLTIRIAQLQDLPAMQTLLTQATRDWSPEILRDCFSEHYFQWIISDEKKLFGFMIIKNNVHAWEVMQIVIDPKFQRQGFAKKLLLRVIDEAKNKIEKIQLEVRASHHAAIALYQQCGFIQVAVRKKYYQDGEDAILMDINFNHRV